MTNFQSDALYNFLNLNNPATNAVSACMNEMKTLQSGNQVEFDAINIKLDSILSGNQAATVTTPTLITTSWTGNNLTGNNLVTGNTVRLTTE